MKKSTKLQIRMSELRSEVNKLEPGDGNVAKRRELLTEIETCRDGVPGGAHRRGEGPRHRAPRRRRLTTEERELRDLDGRRSCATSSTGSSAVRSRKGRSWSCSGTAGLAGSEIPWDMIAPRARDTPRHRAPRRRRDPGTGHHAGQSAHAARRGCSPEVGDRDAWASKCRPFRPGI